jgi:2-oxoglutarate dehydrogenase E2 component (dihydrolipoamide succinyltransferase)
MAVAMDKGLMVPVIPNCEELNFLGLCRKVNDLAVRGRGGKISPDELQGSTFTVSNFGVFGNSFGMPIINQPNSAILGVGAIKKQPVVRETLHGDAVVIRSICNLSIGIDHRLLDGADGGMYLQTLVAFLENLDASALL